MSTAQKIIDAVLLAHQKEYPSEPLLPSFIATVNSYVKKEATLKQMTSARNTLRELTSSAFSENLIYYNALLAALYASYALTRTEDAKITCDDISYALQCSIRFANNAGLKF